MKTAIGEKWNPHCNTRPSEAASQIAVVAIKEAKWPSLRSWATGQAESPLPVSCSGGRHGKSTGADGLTPGTLSPALCQGAVSVKGWRVRATRSTTCPFLGDLPSTMDFLGQLHLCQTLEWALRMGFASQDHWPGLRLSVIWPSPLWGLASRSVTSFLHQAVCGPGTQEMPHVLEFYRWSRCGLNFICLKGDESNGGFERLTNFPFKPLQTFPAPGSSFWSLKL